MGQEIADVEHLPVMTSEVIDGLGVVRSGTFFDCTIGLGGHTQAILKAESSARVIGIDRDPEALEIARKRLSKESSRVKLVRDNFKRIKSILADQPQEW